MPDVPPLAARAEEAARALGFDRSCLPETGRLLQLLAAQRGRARVAELGTGTGYGAAWIASALAPEIPLFTVELDDRLAAVAADLFADDPNVHVLHGDWHELLPPEAPFDLVFYDAPKQQPESDGEQVVALLAPGGTIVLDDLWGQPEKDAVREFWLNHPRLAASEIGVTREMAAIVAVRTL